MTIAYNPANAKFKNHLKKLTDKRLNEFDNPEGTSTPLDAYKRDAEKIAQYILTSRAYLEKIVQKCKDAIDEKLANTMCLQSLNKDIPLEPAILNGKASVFLQKAYTVEAFDEAGVGIENRVQQCIDMGKYLNDHLNELEGAQLLFHDYGKVIGALNSAISQMNRLEKNINNLNEQSDDNEYQLIFLTAKQISPCLEAITTELNNKERPPILDTSMLANIYNDIKEMIEAFQDLFNHYFRTSYETVPTESPKTR